MYIEFTPEETQVLREILQHGLNEMDVEVIRTDTHDFKAMLKHRREVVDRILSKLAAAPVNG